MREKAVGKNIIFSVLKTFINIVFPLITLPYVLRVLQVDAVGKYNFSFSIVSYFALIAALGIYAYSIREGAKIRDDQKKIDRFCQEILSIHLCSTIAAYALLFISIFTIPKLRDYRMIIAILSLEIILSTLSLNWVYVVFEDFTFITLVSFVLEILALIGMFTFVHSAEDLPVYAVLAVIAGFGYGFFSFLYSRRYVHWGIRFCFNKAHLKPIFIIFLATLATTIYISSDTTILGWIKGDHSVGLYGTASRIYLAIKQILNAIIAVMLPRMSYYIGSEKYDQAKEMGSNIVDGMLTLCLPAMIGLMCFSKEFVLVYAGSSYRDSAVPLTLLGVALIFAVFANFYANCLLMAFKQEKFIMIATIISAALNIGLNFVLIPFWGECAAAFTTVLAEMCICIISMIKANSFLKVAYSKNVIFTAIAGSALVAGICFVSKYLISNLLIRLAIGVSLSVFVYVLIQILLKNTFVLGVWRKKR